MLILLLSHTAYLIVFHDEIFILLSLLYFLTFVSRKQIVVDNIVYKPFYFDIWFIMSWKVSAVIIKEPHKSAYSQVAGSHCFFEVPFGFYCDWH